MHNVKGEAVCICASACVSVSGVHVCLRGFKSMGVCVCVWERERERKKERDIWLSTWFDIHWKRDFTKSRNHKKKKKFHPLLLFLELLKTFLWYKNLYKVWIEDRLASYWCCWHGFDSRHGQAATTSFNLALFGYLYLFQGLVGN